MPTPPKRPGGGFTFVEHPGREAPSARIIWRADVDPGILRIIAVPAALAEPGSFRLDRIARWLTVVEGKGGKEHAVLSDGWRHIRLDVAVGSLREAPTVHLRFCGSDWTKAETGLLPMQRLFALYRHGRFAASLFPADPRIGRWVELLRVHDAITAGASHREIAIVLFGAERVKSDWREAGESLRSRVRRLVYDARHMALGGYRRLLRR
ncbi:MAG: DUF2285 domain-containing protein [Novosphingobium sp.]